MITMPKFCFINLFLMSDALQSMLYSCKFSSPCKTFMLGKYLTQIEKTSEAINNKNLNGCEIRSFVNQFRRRSTS